MQRYAPEDGRVHDVDERRAQDQAMYAALFAQHGVQRDEATHRLRAVEDGRPRRVLRDHLPHKCVQVIHLSQAMRH